MERDGWIRKLFLSNIYSFCIAVTQLRIALGVNKRMDELDEITAKHAKQLSGFDAGLTAQVKYYFFSPPLKL